MLTISCEKVNMARNEITLPGFTGLITVQRCARTSRKMLTGDQILVPAGKEMKFRTWNLNDQVDR
jgi:nucleoid DNA-binding protein